jgi:predicted nucleotidyltransferase
MAATAVRFGSPSPPSIVARARPGIRGSRRGVLPQRDSHAAADRSHRAEIAELCRRFHVRRLDVFGSAARGTDFDPARSDVDLLVSDTPGHSPDIGAYLDLQDALAELLGRSI